MHHCDCRSGLCLNAPDVPLIGVGQIDRCPWGELRQGWWRNVVTLWRYVKIGSAGVDLVHDYPQIVARGVLALDAAIRERDAQAAKEAVDNARRGG